MIQRDKPLSFIQALAKQLQKPAPSRPTGATARPPAAPLSGGGGRRPGSSGCACGGKR